MLVLRVTVCLLPPIYCATWAWLLVVFDVLLLWIGPDVEFGLLGRESHCFNVQAMPTSAARAVKKEAIQFMCDGAFSQVKPAMSRSTMVCIYSSQKGVGGQFI
jgi:hypothetical protein